MIIVLNKRLFERENILLREKSKSFLIMVGEYSGEIY